MNLKELLQQIEFVHPGGDDPEVIISINGRAVGINYVERDLSVDQSHLEDGAIVIVPKHRTTAEDKQ